MNLHTAFFPFRAFVSLLALATLASLAGTLAATDPLPAPSAATTYPGVKNGERLREGAKLTDLVGSFQFSGDRIAFQPESSGNSLRVLENLALERVSRLLTEGRGARTWVVSGVVTEYRGTNFLLVTKAVVKLEGNQP